MYWAVAWATKNPVAREAAKHQSKLKHLVIGTHFYQTDPDVLEQFSNLSAAAVRPPTGALFHPKIYLFENGESTSAVVGSHNLTGAAFGGRNVEASVLLCGDKTEVLFKQLKTFIVNEWNEAESIDEDFLYSYRQQYIAKQAGREALKEFHRLKKPLGRSRKPAPMELSWKSFLQGVKFDKHHSLAGRLSILESARELFDEVGSFSAMGESQRKAIAGTLGRKEDSPGQLPWGWFGTMFGLGDFKSLVKHRPQQLSRALDRISLNEKVGERDYEEFATAFRKAFKNAAHKGGIATASRLLAMKRPDLFVAVNGPNKQRLCDAFGVAHTTLSLDNYWERIVVPTQLSPFWNQARPRAALPGRIWDNRAALLDSIYYEPK